MKNLALRLAAAAAGAVLASGAPAATLLVDGDGRLTGATGVDVSGALYDVAFLEGTCGAVFSGCDQATDFAFTTFAGANAAAQALLDQVWIDGPAGQFDSQPNLTSTCQEGSAGSTCFALIPFLPLNPNQAGGRQAQNRADTTPDGIFAFTVTPTSDTATLAGVTWAKFSPSVAGAVPEPETWAMLILGFGAAGTAIRHRRGATRIAFGG